MSANLAFDTHRHEPAVANQGRVGARIAAVEGRELAVDEQQVGHGGGLPRLGKSGTGQECRALSDGLPAVEDHA